MNAKEHIQAALDAIRYNAAVNMVFANGEFIPIAEHLTAALTELETQDESYFEDGDHFEEFPDDEYDSGIFYPPCGDLIEVVEQALLIRIRHNLITYSCPLANEAVKKQAQALCGQAVALMWDCGAIQIEPLPF